MTAPAHTLLRLLRPLVTEYPGPPLAPVRFPPPRPRGQITLPSGRRVTIASDADAIAANAGPQTSILTFLIGTAATSRSTTSSRRIKGPAILKSWHLTLGGAASGTQSFEIGVAPAEVTEVNVGLNGPRQWRPLVERFHVTATGEIAGRIGMPESDFVAGVPVEHYVANIPIVDNDFVLTITNWSSGAGADVFAGHLVIAEGVSREALENFA